MSIQDRLQIVEDNLNEYGQCNITLEEFNYFKEQIRADMIDEFVEILSNPITLDRLTRSRDRIKTLAIIKYQAGILKGIFKDGE